MTEPTDKEQYLNIADQCAATATSDLAASILVDGGNGTLRQLLNDAADAIRAGWCAPPAVAGEPVGEFDQMRGRLVILEGAPMFEHRQKVYTTPQPTQAQAGAVPLTDEPDCGGESCDCRSYCKKKGGQHGL